MPAPEIIALAFAAGMLAGAALLGTWLVRASNGKFAGPKFKEEFKEGEKE